MKLAGSTAILADTSERSALFAALRTQPWVVYAKRPFAGPAQVLQYLGRYTHRVALTNNRLLGVDEREVWFRYKDYAHGNRHRLMRLDAQEFIRRFLLHVLPKGFMRIRHYDLLGNRGKHAKLTAARRALRMPVPPASRCASESVEAFWQRVAGIDIHQCPHCRTGRMRVVAALIPNSHGPPR